MRKIAEEMLVDLDKDTVDFIPNFDDSSEEPVVLPSRVPGLLINGAEGIAVGMASKIPPHNLREVLDATMLLIANPDAELEEIMEVLPGPDFPDRWKHLWFSPSGANLQNRSRSYQDSRESFD